MESVDINNEALVGSFKAALQAAGTEINNYSDKGIDRVIKLGDTILKMPTQAAQAGALLSDAYEDARATIPAGATIRAGMNQLLQVRQTEANKIEITVGITQTNLVKIGDFTYLTQRGQEALAAANLSLEAEVTLGKKATETPRERQDISAQQLQALTDILKAARGTTVT